ncbi:MAG: FAD-dependent oxidoreductase [Microthrixaceae bacterium]|nr:FAD-dependent oxidoreductase [Microthrixaceae bacterium]
MTLRFVIIGGGPAGVQAATVAARLGAKVTLIERDVIGGAANLWDCVPSKAMIATGGAVGELAKAESMGLQPAQGHVDLAALKTRISTITATLERSGRQLLESQGVRIIMGTGRLVGEHRVEAHTVDGAVEEIEADAILVSTGSRPRIPEFAQPDGDRILTTRDAYPPREIPEHLVVIGSGVTGVEFVHMFLSLGSKVTLVVSRNQVLPQKDPEVAAVLEEDFVSRGVKLLKGARAVGIERNDSGVSVICDDGRIAAGSHALLAIGSIPNSEGLGLAEVGVEMDGGYVTTVDHHLRTSLPHIYVAGDLSGKLPLSSVASMQGRKIAEHVMGMHIVSHRHLDYDKAASAIFTDPEIADVGLAEADAFAEGRKVRVTKVPFATTAKALINNDSRGFVKLVSDPATGVVLGGSIVGRHAAELISVIAVAVNAGLRVNDIAESLLVHPALAEALMEAAE